MFARHGIPETLISDNGPQFSGHEMKAFATDYCFEHVTSSPKHPQGNAEAKRAIQTVKYLLKKGKDPYQALLAYRATPLSNGYSPAELLMGRRLRTTLPVLPERLQLALPDLQVLQQKEREKRFQQQTQNPRLDSGCSGTSKGDVPAQQSTMRDRMRYCGGIVAT